MATKKKQDTAEPDLKGIAEAINVPQEEPPAGVFVAVTFDDQGNVSTDLALQGVRITEVQTILELALQGFRQRTGLSGV